MVYGRSPFQNIPLPQKMVAIMSDSYSIEFPKIKYAFCDQIIDSNPWLMDVLKMCLLRNPDKRPTIEGPGGLLLHPFLQPHGQRATLLFQAATLGNDNMKTIVKQILDSSDDPIWEKEDYADLICKV